LVTLSTPRGKLEEEKLFSSDLHFAPISWIVVTLFVLVRRHFWLALPVFPSRQTNIFLKAHRTFLTVFCCSTAGILLLAEASAGEAKPVIKPLAKRTIKTTAYTHSEADHIKYSCKSALGTPLKYGKKCSAAADWSKYPVGTQFRISDNPEVTYEIDDYGSALVGKEIIDLYKPTKKAMNAWGARHVKLEILKWGDYEKSLKILKPRAGRADHVKEMVKKLERRLASR